MVPWFLHLVGKARDSGTVQQHRGRVSIHPHPQEGLAVPTRCVSHAGKSAEEE